MAQYTANTDELRQAAQQLVAKAGEMRGAVAAVENAIAPARAMQSPRITQNVQYWDALKASLEKMFVEADSASTIINTTATEIDMVMAAAGG